MFLFVINSQSNIYAQTSILIFGKSPEKDILYQKLSKKLKIDTTSNPQKFNENTLKNYNAVVFLKTSINALNFRQSAELQRFMKAGGGFVGIHSAAEKSYQWLWYENMISGNLSENQLENKAQISLITNASIGKTDVSPLWKIDDKPLVFNNLPVQCKPVLIDLMGKTWSWYYSTDEGGKMFYTALGGEISAYENPDFGNHILAGIQEVASKNLPEYSKIADSALPNENFFLKIILTENLQNPVSFTTLSNGNVILVEQNGAIKMVSAKNRQTNLIGRMDATSLKEIRLDPEFSQNHYVYTFSDAGNNEYKIGRFETIGDSLAVMTDFSSQSSTPLVKNAIYDFARFADSPYRLPKYFDKKSFRFDNEQGFILETLDENDDVKNIEPFLPNIKFNFIQDLEFGSDGALYFLENNQLQKIDYSETNRKPIANASADIYTGNIPLKVKFSSTGSMDFDPNDTLKYEWNFDGITISYEPNPEFTYTKIGDYEVKLKVTDSKGDVAEKSLLIKATKALKKR